MSLRDKDTPAPPTASGPANRYFLVLRPRAAPISRPHRRPLLVIGNGAVENEDDWVAAPCTAILSGPPIQQEVTEKTEGRVCLRSLRCLMFKTPAWLNHAETRGFG